ncbi:6446_t:CDS:2, partial [Cetraspora pellucida]
TVQKTRKPKTNSFTSILDQVLNKYNLSAELNLLQLHAHADELKALVLKNKKKRLTIKKRAQYCAKTKDMWDIYLHALDLAETKNDINREIVVSSFCLSQFYKELAEAEIDPKQINTYAKLPNITQASNKIQKRKLEQKLIKSSDKSDKRQKSTTKEGESSTLKKLIKELKDDSLSEDSYTYLYKEIVKTEANNDIASQKLLNCYFHFGKKLSDHLNYYKNEKNIEIVRLK